MLEGSKKCQARPKSRDTEHRAEGSDKVGFGQKAPSRVISTKSSRKSSLTCERGNEHRAKEVTHDKKRQEVVKGGGEVLRVRMQKPSSEGGEWATTPGLTQGLTKPHELAKGYVHDNHVREHDSSTVMPAGSQMDKGLHMLIKDVHDFMSKSYTIGQHTASALNSKTKAVHRDFARQEVESTNEDHSHTVHGKRSSLNATRDHTAKASDFSNPFLNRSGSHSPQATLAPAQERGRTKSCKRATCGPKLEATGNARPNNPGELATCSQALEKLIATDPVYGPMLFSIKRAYETELATCHKAQVQLQTELARVTGLLEKAERKVQRMQKAYDDQTVIVEKQSIMLQKLATEREGAREIGNTTAIELPFFPENSALQKPLQEIGGKSCAAVSLKEPKRRVTVPRLDLSKVLTAPQTHSQNKFATHSKPIPPHMESHSYWRGVTCIGGMWK